ncbi:MAG: DUF6146 family protein [Bacteroidales bacterium]
MKIIFIFFVLISCNFCFAQNDSIFMEIATEASDTSQYELTIIEPGFDSWFITNRKPVWYHEETYYKTYNQLYVNEWNVRVRSIEFDVPYDNIIHYNYMTEYGIDLEYKLFWYFKFMEDKYNMKLLATGQK